MQANSQEKQSRLLVWPICCMTLSHYSVKSHLAARSPVYLPGLACNLMILWSPVCRPLRWGLARLDGRSCGRK